MQGPEAARLCGVKYLPILMVVLLGACSDPLWFKAGATPQQLQADIADCKKAARDHSPDFGESIEGAVVMKEFQENCMRSRGYSQSSKN